MTTTPSRALDGPASMGFPPALIRDERRLLLFVAFVALSEAIGLAFIFAFFATSHPPIDATPVEAAVGFRDAGLMIGIATYLAVLPFLFALPFLGGLGSALRRAGGGPLVPTALSAGLAMFLIPAMGGVVSSITPAIGQDDTTAAAGAVVKALDGVMPLSVALAGFPSAVMLTTVAVLLARAGLVGRGMRLAALAIAALSLAGTGTLLVQAMFPLASLAMLLSVAWLTTAGMKLRGTKAQARLAQSA